MSKSAKSVYAFGIYLVGLSIILIAAPNILLKLFGMPETEVTPQDSVVIKQLL